jgi:hypothetical protein
LVKHKIWSVYLQTSTLLYNMLKLCKYSKLKYIFHHTEIAVCFLLQFIHQVGIIDLTYPQIKIYLFLFRVARRKIVNLQITMN